MPLELVAAFWAVSALFVVTPGADWAYAIMAGLSNRTPVPAILGMLTGHLLATLIVAAGVGGLIAGVPGLLTVLTLAGAAYLVWLGIGLLRSPATVPHIDASMAAPRTSALQQAARGLGVSSLNPKLFLLFLALLPQFTVRDAPWPIAVQMIALGLVHIASCAAVYLLVGYGARRVLRTRPIAARIVTCVSGGAMILIGAVLLIEQILHAVT